VSSSFVNSYSIHDQYFANGVPEPPAVLGCCCSTSRAEKRKVGREEVVLYCFAQAKRTRGTGFFYVRSHQIQHRQGISASALTVQCVRGLLSSSGEEGAHGHAGELCRTAGVFYLCETKGFCWFFYVHVWCSRRGDEQGCVDHRASLQDADEL
jgi:hypothetical protein